MKLAAVLAHVPYERRGRARRGRNRPAPVSARRSSVRARSAITRRSPATRRRAVPGRRSPGLRRYAAGSGRGSRAGTPAARVISTPSRATSIAGSSRTRPGQRRVDACAPRRGRRSRPGTAHEAAPMRKSCDDSGVKSTSSGVHLGLAQPAAAETRDGDEVVEHAGRIVGSEVDEHEAARAGAGQRALGDPRDERGRDAGVDGVPARRASTCAPASAVSRWPAATAPLMGKGYSAAQAVDLTSRESSQPASCARPPCPQPAPARLPRCSIWLGPPGLRPRRARLPADAVPRSRLHALEQLLVRGPLQLRHLQPPLLPAGRAVRDPHARRRNGVDGVARLRRPALARVGPGHSLVEPHVRRRLGRDRLLGGVPVRARRSARRCSRCGRSRRAGTGRFAVLAALTLAASPLAFLLLTLLLAGIGISRWSDRRALLAPALTIVGFGAVEVVLWRAVPGSGPLPVLVAGADDGSHLLRARRRAHLASRARALAALDLRRLLRRLPGLLLHPLGDRRERRPPPLRGAARWPC